MCVGCARAASVQGWLVAACPERDRVQDLLWRARVTSEIALIKQTEANNNAAREAAVAAQRAQASRTQAAMTKKVRGWSLILCQPPRSAWRLCVMRGAATTQNYTLEEELELKRVVDMEERKSRKENQRLQAERRARLDAQKKVRLDVPQMSKCHCPPHRLFRSCTAV